MEIPETRICKLCGEEKPLQKFNPQIRSGRFCCSNLCYPCQHKVYKHGATNPVSNKRNYLKKEQDTKVCEKCRMEKPLFSFQRHKRVDGSIGRGAKCQSCRQSPLATKRTYKPYLKNSFWVKFCANCLTVRPLKEFTKKLKSWGYCKDCNTIKTTEYLARKKGSKILVSFTKKDIIKRDGLYCYLCKKLLTEKEATLDHIIPLARGGDHKPENIKVACLSCNSSKNKKTLTEYKKWRGDYDRFRAVNSILLQS